MAKVAVFPDGSFAAYDNRQRTLGVFDAQGHWVHDIQFQLGPVEDLAVTGDTIVVAAVSGDSLLLHYYSRSGSPLASSRIKPFQSTLPVIPGAFPAGAIGTSRPGAVVYVNPMLPEIASISIAEDSIEWLTRTGGLILKRDRLTPPAEGESIILGAACSRQYVVVGYVELMSRRVVLDFLRSSNPKLPRFASPIIG